jgi:phage FluMu protein Com
LNSDSCKHEVLRMVSDTSRKVRCRHCHLVITETELGDSCCPECLEVHKVSRRDFEAIMPSANVTVRYCCEDCGIVIEC